MKRAIYVDYENVSLNGLTCVEKLTKDDVVKIFIGKQSAKLSMSDADRIFNCNAAIELITNQYIGKNALDFIIMVHLGYDIAKEIADEYFIISKDKGYDPAILEMKKKNGSTIKRCDDINMVVESERTLGKAILGLFKKNKEKESPDTTEHTILSKSEMPSVNNGKKSDSDKRKQKNDAKNRMKAENGKNEAVKTDRKHENQNPNSNSAKSNSNRQEINQANIKPALANTKKVEEAMSVKVADSAGKAGKNKKARKNKAGKKDGVTVTQIPEGVADSTVKIPSDQSSGGQITKNGTDREKSGENTAKNNLQKVSSGEKSTKNTNKNTKSGGDSTNSGSQKVSGGGKATKNTNKKKKNGGSGVKNNPQSFGSGENGTEKAGKKRKSGENAAENIPQKVGGGENDTKNANNNTKSGGNGANSGSQKTSGGENCTENTNKKKKNEGGAAEEKPQKAGSIENSAENIKEKNAGRHVEFDGILLKDDGSEMKSENSYFKVRSEAKESENTSFKVRNGTMESENTSYKVRSGMTETKKPAFKVESGNIEFKNTLNKVKSGDVGLDNDLNRSDAGERTLVQTDDTAVTSNESVIKAEQIRQSHARAKQRRRNRRSELPSYRNSELSGRKSEEEQASKLERYQSHKLAMVQTVGRVETTAEKTEEVEVKDVENQGRTAGASVKKTELSLTNEPEVTGKKPAKETKFNDNGENRRKEMRNKKSDEIRKKNRKKSDKYVENVETVNYDSNWKNREPEKRLPEMTNKETAEEALRRKEREEAFALLEELEVQEQSEKKAAYIRRRQANRRKNG